MRRFLRESGACLIAGCLVVISPFAHALDLKAWKASINPQTHERYIPVELWAGAEWDGANALKMPNVDDTYRHRKATYQIKGPMEWEHPAMGRKPGSNYIRSWQMESLPIAALAGLTPKDVSIAFFDDRLEKVDRGEVHAGVEMLGVELREHVQFVIDALRPHAQELGLQGRGS